MLARSPAIIAALLLGSSAAGLADRPRYQFSVVASGLERPVGITIDGSETVYFTVIPMPGVAGGANGVAKLDLGTRQITMLHVGEPEPTHISVDRQGDLYWTCKAAGVILNQTEEGTTSVPRRFWSSHQESPWAATATSTSPSSQTPAYRAPATGHPSATAT